MGALSARNTFLAALFFLASLSIVFLPSYGPTVIREHVAWFRQTAASTVSEVSVQPPIPADGEILKELNPPVTSAVTTTGDQPAPRYVFAFGDSLTALGFSMTGPMPSIDNPFGNPPYPGHSSANGPNWIDNLILKSPPNTLCFDFAEGAAVVDVDIVRPLLSLIPFPYQVQNWTRALATTPRPDFAPWSASDSVAIVFFGVNDVSAIQVYTQESTPESLVERIMSSYFEKIELLRSAGLRRFVFLGVPPLFRFPFAIVPEPYPSIDNLTLSCSYWNLALEDRAAAFRTEFPDVTADVVRVDQFFNEAIDNPTQYGAPNATCNDRDGTSCLFVDKVHPGVQIAKLLGEGFSTEDINLEQHGYKHELRTLTPDMRALHRWKRQGLRTDSANEQRRNVVDGIVVVGRKSWHQALKLPRFKRIPAKMPNETASKISLG